MWIKLNCESIGICTENDGWRVEWLESLEWNGSMLNDEENPTMKYFLY